MLGRGLSIGRVNGRTGTHVARDRADGLRWVAQGNAHLFAAMATLPDQRLEQATALPGWTGRHLLAHVAANAEALGNLVTWARTGVKTPMYSSPAQRDADIEAGSRRPLTELRAWVTDSAAMLDTAVAGLPDEAWRREVRTAQGRTVAATEIVWLRAREVMIHAVDLGAGLRFDDLSPGFLAALVDDIVAKRSASGEGPALVLTATDHFGRWSITGHLDNGTGPHDVSAHTVSAPTASAPTASAPTASAPTASAPTASAPTAGAPTASAPTAGAPTVSVHDVSAHAIDAPSTPALATDAYALNADAHGLDADGTDEGAFHANGVGMVELSAPVAVSGTLAGIAAYLAGRPTRGVVDAPALPRWL